jgi:hypothetical protein
MANAERFASRCVETIFAKLGKQMAYGFVNVMVLTKELVERGSPVLASDILRLYIEKMSSLGGVDVAEILRGMDQ